MTSSHIFFIPLVLLAGFVAGLILGRRSADVERENAARLEARRRARRNREAASTADSQGRHAARDGQSGQTPSAS